jgi:hypothetical protein
VTEAPIQKAIVDTVRWCGLEVYETTAYRQRGASGVDKGVADLLIPHPTLRWTALCMEVKRPGRTIWSSPEQKRAAELAHTVVVRSVDEALVVLREWLGDAPGGPRVSDTLRRIERVQAGLQ